MRPILLMEIKKAYKNKLFLLSMLTASLIALYAAVFSIISYHKYVNADSASAALTGYALIPSSPVLHCLQTGSVQIIFLPLLRCFICYCRLLLLWATDGRIALK